VDVFPRFFHFGVDLFPWPFFPSGPFFSGRYFRGRFVSYNRDDAVVVASAASYFNHLHLTSDYQSIPASYQSVFVQAVTLNQHWRQFEHDTNKHALNCVVNSSFCLHNSTPSLVNCHWISQLVRHSLVRRLHDVSLLMRKQFVMRWRQQIVLMKLLCWPPSVALLAAYVCNHRWPPQSPESHTITWRPDRQPGQLSLAQNHRQTQPKCHTYTHTHISKLTV